jgi:hypothetical protein
VAPLEEERNGIAGSMLSSPESSVPGNFSIPLAIASGRSSSAIVGSWGEVTTFGKTETWFPQRVRAVTVPSVSSFSPVCKLACLTVQ